MPELPEVETVRRQLADLLMGATITKVEIWRSGRERPLGEVFAKALNGRKIKDVHRRAKLLWLELENQTAVLAHLKMTGRFLEVDETYERGPHDQVQISLKDSKKKERFLVWADVRKFGYLRHVSQAECEAVLAEYGPEPLSLSSEKLADHLKARRSTRVLKAVLLDQTVLAGIGNIYADESCFRAGIHPQRRANTLKLEEWQRLTKEIQNVLTASLAQRGTSANDYVDVRGEQGGFLSLLQVYGRSKQPCLRCGALIQKTVLVGRGTHTCPTCQPLRKSRASLAK